MNWFDSAIGAIAPSAALRRVRSRIQLEAITRAYAGAAVGRHTDGWRASGSSADAEVYLAGARLRDRHRDLVRNNPHAAKAVSVLANNIIGEGIIPRPDTGKDKQDAKILDAFKAWCAQCDADGQLDYYGLQNLACREMVEGGEVLVRRRLSKEDDKLTLKLQLLESDFIDDSRTGDLAGNNLTINGVQFNEDGKRVSYWLWPQHPGNNFVFNKPNFFSEPIPAAEILHLYEKQRTQARGVPWGAPVMRALRDLDDYDLAEMVRKKVESSVVGIVTTDDELDENVGPLVRDSHGNIVEKFSPGMIAYARGGKDIKFNAPAMVGGYDIYQATVLRKIASGYRIPYELMTGDLSQVNFSSIRAGLVEFRRFIRHVQRHILIPMFLQPAWDWWTKTAYLAGEINYPVVPVKWQPPKFEWVDPYKDALAELISIRTGTRSWSEVVAEKGGDPAEMIKEITWTNDQFDTNKIILDADPRQVNLKGVMQKLPPPEGQTPSMEALPSNPSGDGGQQ